MDDESEINKEFVKQLFSIQVEGDASKALYVEPKEISVIPHEVAKHMNLPKVVFNKCSKWNWFLFCFYFRYIFSAVDSKQSSQDVAIWQKAETSTT